jgi:hypothetical protein
VVVVSFQLIEDLNMKTFSQKMQGSARESSKIITSRGKYRNRERKHKLCRKRAAQFFLLSSLPSSSDVMVLLRRERGESLFPSCFFFTTQQMNHNGEKYSIKEVCYLVG